MKRPLSSLWANRHGSAATEMALVAPILLILMFGSMELGNFMLNQHALAKVTRDGTRFASRLSLNTVDYDCPDAVWDAPDAETQIENVTKTGSVDGTAEGRFPAAVWNASAQCGTTPPFAVQIRCVDPDAAEIEGMYAGLGGNIPVVRVSAAIAYQSLLSPVGVNLGNTCLQAESEMPVTGL